MDTSTSWPQTQTMPIGELLVFWGHLVDISEERAEEHERYLEELKKKNKGV